MNLAGLSVGAQIHAPMRFLGPLLAMTVLMTPAAPAAWAQDASAENGLVGLTLPLGARVIGQGRAIAAAKGELQGVPYNPAALSGFDRGAVTFSRFEAADAAEFNSNYVGGALATAWGTIGASLMYHDYGEIPLTVDSPAPVGTISPSEWVVGVTYANVWREKLAYGATAKWYRSDLGVAEASGPAFDAGVIYTPRSAVPIDLALSLRNLGPDLGFEDVASAVGGSEDGGQREETLPGRVRVGLAVHPDRFLGLPAAYAVRLLFDVESDVREISTSSQHAGAMLTVNEVVVVRGGVLLADNPFVESGDDDRQIGGAFGIGFRYRGFEADIAREVSVSELGDETHFAVGYRF